MSVDARRLKELFVAASELPPAERAAWLDRECGGDAELRQRVEALLKAHDASGGFLIEPAPDSPPLPQTTEHRPTSGPGMVIAERYTLFEKIGEGGMGEVWVAKQTEPVKRKVALKLIKAGMDSKAVLARFEQERQALALMDHPNIARVLDGGMIAPGANATGLAGQPFFVMELVNGLPLTKFCDQARLAPRERMELFVSICQAVQHAHQKGIVHRDLKPSNILVTLYDGKPVPRVIDFGVAKATSGKLTDESLSTQFGAVIGTFEYMSPEQAGFSGLDIDTRADIYSLGVILYELLTGLRPIDGNRLRQAALAEMLRILKEEEPSKPSTRLSTDESLPSLAALRQTEPKRLLALLRGELDWVVMKCLEKDRSRRYETASGLARDVQRYLTDEPVEARPPSLGYRASKFFRRNKGPVLAASLVLLALVGGIVGTTIGLVRADRQRQLAENAAEEEHQAKVREAEQRQLADEQRKLAEQRKTQAEQNEKKAIAERQISEAVRTFLQRDLLRQADPTQQANALRQLGGGFEAMENPTIKELLNRAAVELTPAKIEAKFPGQGEVQAAILGTVGYAYRGIGEYGRAVEFLRRASNTYRRTFGADHPNTLTSLSTLAVAYTDSGKPTQAIALLEQVCDFRVKKFGADCLETIRDLNNLAKAYQVAGKLRRAIELFEQVRDACVRKFGPYDPSTLTILNNLAHAYHEAKKLPQAIDLLEHVRAASEKTLGADHPDTLSTINNLASVYESSGKLPQAIKMYEQVRNVRVKKLGDNHPATLVTMNNLARAYFAIGKQKQAFDLFEQVHAAELRKLGAGHPATLATLNNLAAAYFAAGKPEKALPLFRQAAEEMEKQKFQHEYARLFVGNLSACYELLNQYAEAETWRRKWLAVIKERDGAQSPASASELISLGRNLLKQQKWIDAEPVLRECLTLCDKLASAYRAGLPWQIANAKSMLGEALAGQKKYADAEPLLLAGYQEMKKHEAALPPQGKVWRIEALERLVQLYDATGKKEAADKCRKELDARQKLEKK